MFLIGAVTWLKAALLIIAQLLGAMAAAGAVSASFPGPLAVRTRLGAGTSISRGVFIEMFLTTLLIFCIFMLAAEKHRSTFVAPIGIGLALFVAELAGEWPASIHLLNHANETRCSLYWRVSQSGTFIRS